MAATEGKLGDLHEAVAEALATLVETDPTPQVLSQAIKFLKDNGIEALPTKNNKLGKLAEALPEFTDEEPLHARH